MERIGGNSLQEDDGKRNGSSGNRTRVLGFEAQEDVRYPMDPPILFAIREDNHSGLLPVIPVR